MVQARESDIQYRTAILCHQQCARKRHPSICTFIVMKRIEALERGIQARRSAKDLPDKVHTRLLSVKLCTRREEAVHTRPIQTAVEAQQILFSAFWKNEQHGLGHTIEMLAKPGQALA